MTRWGQGDYEISLAELRMLAAEAGLDAVGATTPDPFPEMMPRLQAYAQRGRTGFEWEDPAVRIDPKAWLPEAESVVAAAIAYLTREGKALARSHPGGSRAAAGSYGVMSVYTYGQDYHQVLAERLQVLAEKLQERLGRPLRWRVAVDTSPLVDRRVAERAGLGWVGKNCMFFTPQHGSFVFLGALLIDARIEVATAEQPARCGHCQRCLEACPTGALLAPGVLDARRCLSYVTQMKGMVPLELRRSMGRRIWGCDVCQWACPENQQVQAAEHEVFQPWGREWAYPDLLELLHMSNRAFARRFGRTAAAWRGLRTLQRNALLALGNIGRPQAIPYILPFLQHPRPELRASAAWALQQLGGETARQAVAAAYAAEAEPEVRQEMAWAVAAPQAD
ncbi:MAG: tRNA epoxyqueuosine(34) reductase QueG [Alicyclobacillus sp.]|nr:tRNA epoxyqueuosine(34) reductase QueG [Alicyclobacillus sp.]